MGYIERLSRTKSDTPMFRELKILFMLSSMFPVLLLCFRFDVYDQTSDNL